jgi:hypothetical protein
MATQFEKAGATSGAYPPEWPAVAWLVKTAASWRCERCRTLHGAVPHVLTVHHLDGDKANLEHWNLAALCQRCHLQVQARVAFYQDWPFPHTAWMARHVADYNEWAARHGRPVLSLAGVVEADPMAYWSQRPAVARPRRPAGSSIEERR